MINHRYMKDAYVHVVTFFSEDREDIRGLNNSPGLAAILRKAQLDDPWLASHVCIPARHLSMQESAFET